MITVSIVSLASQKALGTFTEVDLSSTVKDLKNKLCVSNPKLVFSRTSLRPEPRSKTLQDNTKISEIPDAEKKTDITLYYKDLGPQVGWDTVFYWEYIGPPVLYTLIWALRQPGLVPQSPLAPMKSDFGLRHLALACYVAHFLKRVLETRFVHRFSHATMPMSMLTRNCMYYWFFALGIGYHTNHNLYTAPYFGMPQVYTGLAIFLLSELGNFQCHMALKNLRPAGSTVRKIPRPVSGSPLTFLFNYVACPNYFYEVMSWIGFSIMTQTLPVAVFTVCGAGTMAVWAAGKLRRYRAEFPQYPRRMKAIFPFIY